MPMQPSPIADTSRPLLPSLRCFMMRTFRGVALRRPVWALPGREIAKPVSCCHAAIHENITARDERTVRAHQESADVADFIGCRSAPHRAELDHAAVAFSAWPRQFVAGQWRDDDAGAYCVD